MSPKIFAISAVITGIPIVSELQNTLSAIFVGVLVGYVAFDLWNLES